MRQHVQGQQAEQQVQRSERPLAHSALATDALATDSRELGRAYMSGSGWAIELQETQLLLRRAFAPAPPHRTTEPPVRELDAMGPRLGFRPVALTLLCCLLLLVVASALDGMQQYARIRTQADDALHHLRAAGSLLEGRQPGEPLPATTLAQLQTQLSAAEADFAAIEDEVGNPSGVVLLGTLVPHLSTRIAAAADVARAGDDACQGLSDLVTASNDLLTLRTRGFLDASGQLTQKGRLSLGAVALQLHLQAALIAAAEHLDAAAHGVSPVDLAILPPTLASSRDLATLSAALKDWPRTRAAFLASDGWRLLLPLTLGTPALNR